MQEPSVCGHPVTDVQQDHIAGNQITGRESALHTVPDDGRGRCGQLAERLERPLGTVLLEETEHDGERHDHRDHDRFDGVAHGERKGCPCDQDEDEDVPELREEDSPARDPAGGADLVGPVVGDERVLHVRADDGAVL